LIIELKILTNYVPEVSVRHKVLTLCPIIRCKTHLDQKSLPSINFSLLTKNGNRRSSLSTLKSTRNELSKDKIYWFNSEHHAWRQCAKG